MGVNRSTVVLAYEELRARGLIESYTGSGTRVSLNKWSHTPKQTPNWRQYVEEGQFLPNPPFMRRIRNSLLKDRQLIDFASGELARELTPSREIARLMQEHPFLEHLGYENPQGSPGLREVVVSHLKKHRAIDAAESSILITSGSQQSLYLITQCLLSPGDAVAIEDPSYCYSLSMFQTAGLRLFPLPVDEKGIQPEAVAALYKKHRIRMIFLNPNFQNPTGTVLDLERRSRLLEIAGELGIPLVEDDPFSLTAYDGKPPPALKALDRTGGVLYMGSFSKIAASGLRIGWMVAPHSVIERLADAKQQMDFGISTISQGVAAQFLRSSYSRTHLDRLRMHLMYRRDLMIDSLEKELSDQVSFSIPQGGFHIWCKISDPVQDNRLLEECIRRKVVYVPGSVYGAPSGYVRFTYARPGEEEIKPGIQRFAMALHSVLSDKG